MWDDEEEDRLDHIQNRQARGKGAPKKKKSRAGTFSNALLFPLSRREGGFPGTLVFVFCTIEDFVADELFVMCTESRKKKGKKPSTPAVSAASRPIIF